MATAKILIVEDDLAIRTLIERFLRQKSYQIESAGDGQSALGIFRRFSPDLVILDVNLPDILGYDLCVQMRNFYEVYVLFLSNRNGLEDKERGFKIGGDDYLTKPFDLQELQWRIESLLRRQRVTFPQMPNALIVGNLVIYPEKREVKLNKKAISLTVLEFDLLYFLASHPGRIWSREQLVHQVWKNTYVADTRVVDVHIGHIREKIEECEGNSSFIQTIRGVGYKFEPRSNLLNPP